MRCISRAQGVRRIVVCESWELDGYRVGRVRPLTDEEVQSAEEANEIQAFSAVRSGSAF